MIRNLAFVISILLIPGIVHALGLGKLDLRSNLNEPLDARIELLSATADELDSLKIGLAGSEDFKRADIDRSFNLTKLFFEVKETSKGKDYIRVYSKESIREPFLHFLVEINWNRGRLLREYTVLLDPPTYSPISRLKENISQPKATLIPQKSVTTSSPVPVRSVPGNTIDTPANYIAQDGHNVIYDLGYQAASSPTPSPSQKTTPAVNYNYTGGDHTTVRGDTLWALASQMRPDNSVSIQQTMLAMLRDNPEAFLNSNINDLKTGQVLTNPDLSDIQSLSKSEAIAQVGEQNSLWESARDMIADNVTERPESSGVSTTSSEATESESTDSMAKSIDSAVEETNPELTLVGSGDTEAGVGQGSGEMGSDSAVMTEDLALAQESLVTLESENRELKEKLIQNESIIEDLNRLIVLKEDELSALRAQLSGEMPEQVMEEELPEELEEPELMEEELPEEIMDESTASESFNEDTVFISEEELPQVDPTEYGELYSEEPDMEEDPGMEEELPLESEEAEEFLEEDPGMLEEFPGEEELSEETMDQPMEEELLEELPEKPIDEAPIDEPSVSEEPDSSLGAVSGLLDTVKEYFAPMAGFVSDNLKLLGSVIGGLVVLMLGFFGFNKLRSNQAEVMDLDDDDDIMSFDNVDSTSKKPDVDSASEKVVLDEPVSLDISENSDVEKTGALEFGSGQTPGFAEPQSIDDSDEDPLAEVNVFLAYEHFDQAEEFVKKAIEESPDNLEYHTKLLEVYYAASDKTSYEQAAKVLHDKVNGAGSHWDMTLAMWSEMSPNRALFEERVDGLDDTQALASGAAERALTSGVVDLTTDAASSPGIESDLFESGNDVFDITSQNKIASDKDPEDLLSTLSEVSSPGDITDENILDVSAKGASGGHLLDLSGSGEIDLLDSSSPMESTDHILDLTGGDGGEDILDITAGSQEDLLDVTASTDLGSLPSFTRKSDIEEESTLDFDVQAFDLDMGTDVATDEDSASEDSSLSTIERAMDTIDMSASSAKDDNVVDFDLPIGSDLSASTSLDLDVSGSFDMDVLSDSKDSTGEELTVEFDSGGFSQDSADEPSLDVDLSDDVTRDFETLGENTDDLKSDLGEDSDEDGMDIDLTNEFTLDEENTDSMAQDFDLELQDDDEEELLPNTEMDIDMEGTVEMPSHEMPSHEMPTVEMPKIDFVDDDDDKTVFIPRSAGSEQQSMEDEISTKLDLAKAYVELGDNDSAKAILDEIVAEGNAEQKKIAEELLTQVT